MKLAQDHGNAGYRIRAFEPGWIRINQAEYQTSVLVTPTLLSTDIRAERLEELTLADLQPAIDLEPELILLGTGSEQSFPDRELMRALIGSGIGFEAMDTRAACRTFNLLLGEDRSVAAVLLLR
ncbi:MULTISPECIES: Mth938-like domain-containing protein [Halorhodospira]|uniref:Mth938-like domain-containing protein n=1 Tax=Halorhodospira TaxID=85108 RepID=UPI001EE7888F|nr:MULTISPECIES: Mth938-like domain-containing protein [Halorhodospira]MCG5528238.1 Mth938-like domain-containing protein [Halorhodospira halophila]MCG5543895.1 Mth938-like domain-containing protein [Halorhodospira sp. 9628]